MYLVFTGIIILGFELLKMFTIPPVEIKTPETIIILFALILIAFISFFNIKLWRWYDEFISMFAKSLRVLDIFTWGLLLWFCIVRYKDLYLEILWRFQSSGDSGSVMYFLPVYLNIYTWGVITSVGFIIIGTLRLLVNSNLFK